MIGTAVGAVAIVVLTACFPQQRVGFLVGLALWGGFCHGGRIRSCRRSRKNGEALFSGRGLGDPPKLVTANSCCLHAGAGKSIAGTAASPPLSARAP
jgi:hypothetical protein